MDAQGRAVYSMLNTQLGTASYDLGGLFGEVTVNLTEVFISGQFDVEVIGFECQGDVDGNGVIGILDLLAVLDEWGVDNFSGFKPLWSANLTNVDFTGANLSYSDFSYSNMLGAKLENATLTGAKWYYTACPDGTNSGKTGSCAIE